MLINLFKTDKASSKIFFSMRQVPFFSFFMILTFFYRPNKYESYVKFRSDSTAKESNAIVKQEFIFTNPPFKSCHASTIVETKDGLLAAWFGGTHEGNPDVGIWTSRCDGKKWSKVIEVATGIQKDGKKFPCYNPVLFQPKNGPLILFYKVGPYPAGWWGMLITSTDEGKTWSKPKKLPDGILGPIKDKPVQLSSGTILCGSSTEFAGWQVHMELTSDYGKTWEKTSNLNDTSSFQAIQPTILVHSKNSIQILCRTKEEIISQCWSADGGKTWTKMTKTDLPNPNSGIDAVMLKDGRALLVYNDTKQGRTPLDVAISKDGKKWKNVVVLEDQPGEYSYPAVIQTSDGLVHITYTWKRLLIKHVVIDPTKL
jgi:predicted neuraminidase